MIPGLRSKRGNVFDMFPILLIIATALVVMIVFVKLVDNFNTDLQADTAVPSEAKQFMSNIESQNAWVLDFLFLMVLISLPLASAVLGWLNDIPPFFFWASIGVWLFVIVLANIIGDAYTNIVSDGNLQSTVSQIPMTNFVMEHFILYIFVCLLIISFGVYVKSSNVGYYP